MDSRTSTTLKVDTNDNETRSCGHTILGSVTSAEANKTKELFQRQSANLPTARRPKNSVPPGLDEIITVETASGGQIGSAMCPSGTEAKPETETVPGVKPKTDAKMETETTTEDKMETEATSDACPGPAVPKPVTASEAKPETEATKEPKAEAEATEAKPDTEAESGSAEGEFKSEAETDTKTTEDGPESEEDTLSFTPTMAFQHEDKSRPIITDAGGGQDMGKPAETEDFYLHHSPSTIATKIPTTIICSNNDDFQQQRNHAEITTACSLFLCMFAVPVILFFVGMKVASPEVVVEEYKMREQEHLTLLKEQVDQTKQEIMQREQTIRSQWGEEAKRREQEFNQREQTLLSLCKEEGKKSEQDFRRREDLLLSQLEEKRNQCTEREQELMHREDNLVFQWKQMETHYKYNTTATLVIVPLVAVLFFFLGVFAAHPRNTKMSKPTKKVRFS